MFVMAAGRVPLVFAQTARQTRQSHNVLVAIFQRGAMDGLMAVSPHSDSALQALRPGLFIPADNNTQSDHVIDLDGRFGLHPSLGPFEQLFQQRHLAIVHGVGSPDNTRSHFDAQDYMETGTPGNKSTQSGWLNRATGLLEFDQSPLQAVALTHTLPRSLYGKSPTLAIDDIQKFGLRGPRNRQTAGKAEQLLKQLYARSSRPLLQQVSRESFTALDLLSALDSRNYRPANGARYPNSELGKHLEQIALLIKADIGLNIAFTESVGWDTHIQQGTVSGSFAQLTGDLAQAIAAFWTDLHDEQDRVVVLTMTEFGRTVHENGSGGTDHGRGSCLFVLGQKVIGGKVYGNVPDRLTLDTLEDGRDLPVTTDFRAVFAEVTGTHLGISDDQALFPGWAGTRLPLFRSS